MKQLKANDIISKRDNLSKNISNYWQLIYAENKVQNGFQRNYDVKALLKQIIIMANDRAQYKLYAQAINMGYTNYSEFPKNSIYPIIYQLSELQERSVKFRNVPVVTNKKSKYNDVLKKVYIDKLITELSVEIAKLRMKLQQYNDNATLTIEEVALLKKVA